MELQSANYHDFTALADLRRKAAESPGDALESVARQFESLFLQMMLKSMRSAVPEGGLFEDQSGQFYREMLDSQWAVTLSEGGGIGLAEIITRQLSGSPVARSNGESEANSAAAEATRLQLQRNAVKALGPVADNPSEVANNG